MLLDKPLGDGDVISIKLSNGDEVIGKLIGGIESTVVTISKPLLMTLVANHDKPAIQMVPFFMLGADRDGKFPINTNHIMCLTKSDPAAAKNYIQVTTGLTIPGASTIQKLAT